MQCLEVSVYEVQGHLFRAAFVKKVPLFMQNIGENVLLCLVASGIEATSRRCLTLIDLQWQRTLTARIHKHYFQNMVGIINSHGLSPVNK